MKRFIFSHADSLSSRQRAGVRRFPSFPLAALSLLAAAMALAQPGSPRVLFDGALQPHPIHLISINDDAIVYEDNLGRRRTATIGGFVALLPALPAAISSATPAPSNKMSPGTGLLEMTDGQRFPGRPAATGGMEGALVWSHPLFGRIIAPIDSIARIAMTGDAVPRQLDSGNKVDDQLVLSNGDRLVGLVLNLADPIEFEVDDHTLSIPMERVADASLANPSVTLSGMVVWLDDGSVAVVASLETTPDHNVSVRLQDGQAAEIPLDQVRAVAFDAGRLRSLVSIDIESQEPLGDRGVFDPVRVITSTGARGASDLNAPDLMLPGPMRAHWTLPAGVVRLAGVAEMPLESLPWGDCELVISQNNVELLRHRLNQEQPRIEFSLVVEPGELTIAVEPGAFGPINDRVVLRRPLLLSQ